MDKQTHPAPNRLPWPPILYLIAILAGFAAQHYYPLPWLSGVLADLLFMLGVLMVIGALFTDFRTFLELKKHKTTIMPTKAADHLVTSGPFSFSRNPIYLSNTALTYGLAFAFGIWWLLLSGTLAAIATNHLAIKREESHLDRKFGNEWRKYKKAVRRWI